MTQRVLILFDGKSGGLIERMASLIATGVREVGLVAISESVTNARPEDLLEYDGLILGSACYFATVTGRMKVFMDATYPLRGKLDGKVGGAFTASEHIAGGNEMTLRTIHDFFLFHGMIIQGDPVADPFGPVAINPDEDPADIVVDDSGECERLGKRVALLIQRLHSR